MKSTVNSTIVHYILVYLHAQGCARTKRGLTNNYAAEHYFNKGIFNKLKIK